MLLHIMVDQNSKKWNVKKKKKFKFHMMWGYSMFVPKKKHHNVYKMQIYSRNGWNDF
jgi:hypothetical protein